MNSCLRIFRSHASPWRVGLLAILLLLTTLVDAQQAARPFPKKARHGVMQVVQPPQIMLDGISARLAPGVRIRGTNNMLVMSGELIGKSLTVAYVRDPQGELHDVWILTAAEAQLFSSSTQSNYVTDYDPKPPSLFGANPASPTPANSLPASNP